MDTIKTMLIFFLAILSHHYTSAQFICTTLNPVITNSGNASQDIDLNNDATFDFRIISGQTGTVGFVIMPGGQIGTGNFVLANGFGALALPLAAVIGPTSTTWTQMNTGNQQMVIALNTTVTGNWAGATDQYLGLKLIVGVNTYYGWARFSFSSSSNSYTFIDYAYNSVSNQQILAGQGCGSLAFPIFSIANPLCVGSTATINANTGTFVPTGYAWVASPVGATFSSQISQITSVTFSAAGVYTVMLVAFSGTNIGIAQNTVLVGFTPTLTSNSPVCSGESLVFSSGGGTTYSWVGPIGFVSAIQNPSILIASQANNGVYTLNAVSAAGCSASATTSIIIKPIPIISVSPNSPTICAGTGINLSSAGTATAFNWSPLQGLSGSGPQVYASPTVTTIYTCTGSLNGCTNVATTTVNVENPIGQGNIILGSGSICAQAFNGSPNSNTIAISGGNSYTISTINPSNITNANTGNLTTVFTALPPYQNVMTTATPTIMCTDGICTVYFPVQISIIPNPTITLVPNSNSTCSNQAVTFIATGATTYLWDNGSQGLSSYTSGTVIANAGVTTIYPVYGGAQGCNSASENATLTIKPAPSLTANNATTCLNQPVILSASGATNYIWTGPIGFTANTQNVSIPASGVLGISAYTITGTGVNSCTATSVLNLNVLKCTGINQLAGGNMQSKVHPNPVYDKLYIQSDQAIKAVEIIDVSGKIAFKKDEGFEWGVTQHIDVINLPGGIYLLKIILTGLETEVIRFVKE